MQSTAEAEQRPALERSFEKASHSQPLRELHHPKCSTLHGIIDIVTYWKAYCKNATRSASEEACPVFSDTPPYLHHARISSLRFVRIPCIYFSDPIF